MAEAESLKKELKCGQGRNREGQRRSPKSQRGGGKSQTGGSGSGQRAEDAAAALKKALEEPDTKKVEKGQTYSDGILNYKVTSVQARTVSVSGPVKKNVTSVTIPSAMKIEGSSYKVTAVEKNAFKSCKKLSKVTIGKNVKTIGSSAFYKNSRLKSVAVKTNVLKTVGKNAFKGICKRHILMCRIVRPEPTAS